MLDPLGIIIRHAGERVKGSNKKRVFTATCENSAPSHALASVSIVSYPASFSECLSIAAVSKKDGMPVAPFSNSNVEVDYAGIGVDVISMKPYGGFQKMSGTSMACPHVAGFVAAILTNSTKKDNIRQRLTDDYAKDIGIPGKDVSTGLGFVTYLKREDLSAAFERMGIEVPMEPKPKVNLYSL
jgi:subtilisin family serine protease